MAAPETRLKLGGCDLHLLGTVAGFGPDAARVEAALAAGPVARIAVGVPPEDLAGLAILADAPAPHELIAPHEKRLTKKQERAVHTGGLAPFSSPMHPTPPEAPADDGPDHPFAGLDAATAHLLELLRRFGPVSAASPDLLAAHRGAARLGIPLEAVDLDDAAHTAATTKAIGLLGLRGRAKAERDVLALDFADAVDAYDLAVRFDAERNATRGLRKVESAREGHMADRLATLAGQVAGGRIVAVVPAARMAGIVARLSAKR